MSSAVGKSIPKKDGESIIKGRPVYTNDMAKRDPDALVVKILRSPHAYARIKSIDVSAAKAMEGVATVITHLDKDVPRNIYTRAGQGFPEPSPYDKFILDEYVRYVGDEVMAVAAVDERTAQAALDTVKVEYEVLEAVLDFEKAEGHKSIIHNEPEACELFPIGFDPKKNIAAAFFCEDGDTDGEMAKSDIVVEDVFYTQAQAHYCAETHTCYTYFDGYDRLNVISSTQVPHHIRRIISKALNYDRSKLRVHKPKVGGGYGGKQQIHGEMLACITTLRTGKPALCNFTRKEVFESTFARHQMKISVKIGANNDGTINAIDMDVLSNTGAYGEHALTVFMLAGGKTLPLYAVQGRSKAVKFGGKVVYTNRTPGGAYRGYGAMQGNFALESVMDMLAEKVGVSPAKIREMNMIKEGETSPLFKLMGEGTEGKAMMIESCKLEYCVKRAKELAKWNDDCQVTDLGNGKVRSQGMAIAMQGSGIQDIDMASAALKLNDDGFFNLTMGATEIGQGSDTILAQIAADVLNIDTSRVIVYSSDTDLTPFDPGAYASKTTYVTGNAVIKTAKAMKAKIEAKAAAIWGIEAKDVEFDGKLVKSKDGKNSITIEDLGSNLYYDMGIGDLKGQLMACESFVPEVSPPPYMAAIVDITIDKVTGHYDINDYIGVIDCGGLINPALVRVQGEGGLVQGIGMACYEDVTYSDKGQMLTNSLFNYKLPARKEVPKITVEFAESYDPTGPYGAKSIGEIGIDTPMAAIANAIYAATGVRIKDLPLFPEKVLMGMKK